MKRFKLLVWGGFAITVVVSAGAIFLSFAPLPGLPLTPDAALNDIIGLLSSPFLALVGAVVAANRRQNPIGWLLIAIGFVGAAGNFLTIYAQVAFWTGTETLPGGLVAAWAGQWLWLNIFIGLILLFHLFPTGSFLSRRWRRVATGSVLVLFGLMIVVALGSPIPVTTSQGTLNLANPIGLFVSDPNSNSPWFILAFVLPLLAALGSLLLRFVRARGVEREQIKWVWYAAALLVISVIPGFFITTIVFQIFSDLIVMCLPLAIGIAILKYRLYDIDILIRRTITYALVAALLAIVYFGSVIVLQQLFAAVTVSGQNEIVTVFSTLAIAALFVPVRNRIQREIDKRFNRKKYDAQQILGEFANTVRDETDLEKLSTRLMQVVDETMQPKSVTMWLKRTDKIGSRSKG